MRFCLTPFVTLLLSTALTSGCVMTRTDRSPESSREAITSEQAIINGLTVMTGLPAGSRVSPEQALADLQDHEDATDPKEKDMIGTLVPVITKVVDAEGSITPDEYRRVYDVMERMADMRPNDFEVQYAMATGMTAMASSLKSAGGDVPQTGETRAKNLASKFPTQARAYAHLGATVAPIDEELAMRSYARCMKLDPGIVGCKTGLIAVAGRFQEPRCTKVDAKRFSLHPAYAPNAATAKAGRKGLKPIKLGKRQLLMTAKAAIDGSSIEEAVGNNDLQDPNVTVTLTPQATAKLAEVTAELAERQGFLAIVIDGKAQSAPQVMSPIESGVVVVSGVALSKLCSKLEKRTLPPDIAPLL